MDWLVRLNEFIESQDITDKELSDVWDVTEKTVYNRKKGLRKIEVEELSQLLASFPNLSAEWLLRGEGEMLKGSVPQTALVDLESEYNRGFHDGVCSVTGFRSQKNASGV